MSPQTYQYYVNDYTFPCAINVLVKEVITISTLVKPETTIRVLLRKMNPHHLISSYHKLIPTKINYYSNLTSGF